MLGKIVVPLRALDAFIIILEQEHFQALDDRWERTRQQGRELSESFPALQSDYAAALNYSNEAEQTRGRRKADFAQRVEERGRISNWATAAEVSDADERMEKAGIAMDLATQKAFQRQQELATAESKVASAKENLALFSQEMRRCEAELKG